MYPPPPFSINQTPTVQSIQAWAQIRLILQRMQGILRQQIRWIMSKFVLFT